VTTDAAPHPLWRRKRRRILDPGVVGIVLGLGIGALLWWGFTASGNPPVLAALPADPTPAPVSAPPPALPESLPSTLEPPPALLEPLPATPEPPRAAVAPEPAGPWVQLAALRSEHEADATWQSLRDRHAALLGAREPRVVRFVRGNEEFFRLRVGPFSSRAEASALCDVLRNAGNGCFVTIEE
jgi:cell division septation protein DedD